MRFAEVIDAADQLSFEERETLIDILQHRLNEARRAEVLSDIKEGTDEFESGRCRETSVETLAREIFE
ncbi:MAG: hypothetical protein O2960_19175 [Verrucomicrobia bacterium]|nr:hypothetical protein [Verrucomicrobiota bacterium]